MGHPEASSKSTTETQCRLGGTARQWLHIDQDGNITYRHVDKHALVTELGVPYRDLRILDPKVPMPYPSAIFIREKAMVVNLESIRMIVCKDYVYVLSIPNPDKPCHGIRPTSESSFVMDLVHRLTQADSSPTDLHIDMTLPFELRALEAAVSGVAKILETEASQLEAKALPALDRLTKKVSRGELETVRNVKSSLNRLMGRVTKVKEGLEKILDDDQDMHNMYLGRRADAVELTCTLQTGVGTPMLAALQRLASTATRLPAVSETNPGITAVGLEPGPPQGSRRGSGAQAQAAADSASRHGSVAASMLQTQGSMYLDDDSFKQSQCLSRRRTQLIEVVDPHDIEGCEALLEAYFMQVDYINVRLCQLKERIEDTEVLIRLDLDHRRNDIVTLNLAVGCITMTFAFVSMVAGIFGMNLFFPFVTSGLDWFLGVALGSCIIAVAMFIALGWYARRKRLLFVPSYEG